MVIFCVQPPPTPHLYSFGLEALRSLKVALLRSQTSPVWTSLTTVNFSNLIQLLLKLKPVEKYVSNQNYDLLTPGLDSDLSTLLVWLAKNRSIRHLSLGKNFNNIKSK